MTHKDRRNQNFVNVHIVNAGEIIIAYDKKQLLSVVSNGIVVCIWNKKNKSAGLCHFKYPLLGNLKKATGQYGNVAINYLIKKLKSKGNVDDFEAQIFGGALLVEGQFLGEENYKIAKKILEGNKIPIVSEDIGGKKGRKILFDCSTGHCAVVKVHTLRKDDWISEPDLSETEKVEMNLEQIYE